MNHPKLIFNKYGLLRPTQAIATDLETMEEVFVKHFPKSATRKQLFENYQRYLYRFQDEVFPWFEQWVNGSFVTMKENPKDIDFVTFVDYKVFELRGDTIEKFWGFNDEWPGLDTYVLDVYPEEHPNYSVYEGRRDYWKRLFVRNRNLWNKGFLKLTFGKFVE